MKKLLALVLALVMSMSLVTISNAAFKDADKISNKEAVDVMAAVGVLAGYDNGEFGATDTLTRAQACKIIAYLDLGGKTADAIKGSGTVFSDVAATAWYAGYVEYCAGAGYVAGIGGGKFDPNANVTGVQFAKMLLCALGYKADVEGYTGADYTIAIARDANKVDLFDALSIVTSAALTREQAAQMAFNALKATVVEYQGGTNVTTSDGTSVVVNAVRSEVANDKYDYRVAIGYSATTDDTKQQLCEKLYGKDIKLGEGDPDDFGRPSNQWSYKNDDIGTYETSDAVVVYTASTKESVVKADLKNYTLGLKQTGMWVDGKQEAASGTDDSAIVTAVYGTNGIEDLTGNGRIVEVYATNKVIDKIVVINAQLAKVSAVSTKNETVTYDFAKSGMADITSDVGYGKVNKGDYVMVNVKATSAPTTANPAVSATVLGVAKATVVTGKITAKETGKNVTIAGTKYDIAVNTVSSSFDPAVSNTATVDAYIDTFGYVVDTTANTAAGNYLLVTKAVFSTTDALNNTVYKAQVVKTDGTIEIVTVTNSSGAVGLYSYSVSDGKYTLTAAKATDSVANYGQELSSQTISKSTVKIGSHYFADDVNFIVVKNAGQDNMKANVYTGKQPLAGAVTVYYLTSKSVETDQAGTITTAFVVGSDVVSTNDSVVFSTVSAANGSVIIGDSTYSTYSLYVDGEKKTVAVTGSTTPAANKFYTYTTDSNGVYTLTETSAGVAANKTISAYNNYVTVADITDTLTATSDVKVIDTRTNPDTEITTVGTLADQTGTVTGSVVYDGDAKTVSVIYITNVA